MIQAAFKLLILLLCFTSWCYKPVQAACQTSDNENCPCGISEERLSCCFRVSENEAGANVGLVANDPSLQDILNGTEDVTYSLLNANEELNVTENGFLQTAKALDRETIGDEGCFIAVVEVSHNDQANNILVAVQITDVNDNPPRFINTENTNSTLTESVQESDDTQIDICSNDLVATDEDLGENGTFEYSIVSPEDNFTVFIDGPDAVCLRTLVPLDREEMDTITIVLQAEDNGVPTTLSSLISIILQIEDANDNAPMFIEPNLSPNINETAANDTLVVRYTAVDKDIGSNGDVSFSIAPNTPQDFPFRLNPSTGEIFLNGSLDYDGGTKIYPFEITAKDNGDIPKDYKIDCQINVLNVNNKEPIIDNEDDIPLVFVETEGVVNNPKFLTVIRISDDDSETFSATIENGSEYCTIVESMNPNLHLFLLQLSVNELDYESVQEIPVVVVISDNGDPALTATLVRTIRIDDINDNQPYLTQTTFDTLEEQNFGSPFIMLRDFFADMDDGSNGELGKFVQLNGTDLVEIDQDTGEIRTANRFDREEIGSYIKVQVQIFDNGLNSTQLNSTETIVIHLLDKNDNSPVFNSSSVVCVNENELSYVNFTKVQAEDPDEGSNGIIRYEIQNSSIFSIDSKTGFLSSMEAFDREMTSSYNVTIVATDLGDDPNTAYITLVIKILDVNDNPPVFITPFPTYTISSDDPIGTIVGVIEVNDNDTGENAAVGFFLSNTTYFNINDSGVIQIVQQLPVTSETKSINLIVTVYNIEDVNMNSSTTLIITINPEPTKPNFDDILIYFFTGLTIVLLLIAIAFTVMLICFFKYCRNRCKSEDLSCGNATVDHGVPRRSSLRATPSAGRDINNSFNHLENVPRSPTVLFSSEFSVRYYDQEEATTKSEFETRTVRVDNSGDIESPQIPTKDSLKGEEEKEEEEEEEEEKVSSPQLSDLSTNSSISNSSYPPYYHQIGGNRMTLREDVLKKHDKTYSESFLDNPHDRVYREGLIPHERVYTDSYMGTNRLFPTGHVIVDEPIDKEDDDTSHYNDDNLPPVFQQYLSSRPRSNQSISAPVSHYVSQNGNSITPTDASPTLRYIHQPPNAHTHLQHKSVPAVYYQHNHISMPVSPRTLHPVDSIPYDQPLLTSSHHMNGTLRQYSSSSSSSSHHMHSELPPQTYPHHPSCIHYTSRHSHDLPTVQINGRRSPPEYHPHIPPTSHVHACEHHRSYQHPILQDKLALHPSSVNYAYHSFASEDNSTVASSVLDDYLKFDHNSQKQDYLFSEDAISMDEMKFSSTDIEKQH